MTESWHGLNLQGTNQTAFHGVFLIEHSDHFIVLCAYIHTVRLWNPSEILRQNTEKLSAENGHNKGKTNDVFMMIYPKY